MRGQFELEKRKLKQEILMRESSVYSGIGSWLMDSLLGSKKLSTEAKAGSLLDKSVELLEQIHSQDKIETIAKASSLFTSKKTGSLGLIVMGSIVGGILASQWVGKGQTTVEKAPEISSLED